VERAVTLRASGWGDRSIGVGRIKWRDSTNLPHLFDDHRLPGPFQDSADGSPRIFCWRVYSASTLSLKMQTIS